jgi:putative component of toxin-antitoxin plasmid stabilization module
VRFKSATIQAAEDDHRVLEGLSTPRSKGQSILKVLQPNKNKPVKMQEPLVGKVRQKARPTAKDTSQGFFDEFSTEDKSASKRSLQAQSQQQQHSTDTVTERAVPLRPAPSSQKSVEAVPPDGGKGKEKGAKPAKATSLKSKLMSLSSKDKKVSSFPFFPSVFPSFLHFGLPSSLLSFLPFVIGSLPVKTAVTHKRKAESEVICTLPPTTAPQPLKDDQPLNQIRPATVPAVDNELLLASRRLKGATLRKWETRLRVKRARAYKNSRICDFCQKPSEVVLAACTHCHLGYYCNAECQQNHADSHRNICDELKEVSTSMRQQRRVTAVEAVVVFMQAGVRRYLSRRSTTLSMRVWSAKMLADSRAQRATIIQSAMRLYVCRNKFLQQRHAAIRVQVLVRGFNVRCHANQWQLPVYWRHIVRIQTAQRLRSARRKWHNLKCAVVVLQTVVRKFLILSWVPVFRKRRLSSACAIQAGARYWFAMQHKRQQEEASGTSAGAWRLVVHKVLERELQLKGMHSSGSPPGPDKAEEKSWVEMKMDLEFVAQTDSIFDLVSDDRKAPVKAETVKSLLKGVSRDVLESILETLCSDSTPLTEVLSVNTLRALSDKASLSAAAAAVVPSPVVYSDVSGGRKLHEAGPPKNTLEMTKEAFKWVKQQKDYTLRHKLAKRLEKIARGNDTYSVAKPLKGGTRDAMEAKLDTGDRIIWTQRTPTTVLIWYICKHKHINRSLNLIEQSYDRLLASNDALTRVDLVESSSHGGPTAISDVVGIASREEPEMLVDPSSNVPLKIYSLPISKLNKLADDPLWVPPVKLTKEEEGIVRHAGTGDGATLLLGRSGTGKTLCVTSRMAHDRHVSRTRLQQLFIARNTALCETVRVIQVKAGEDVSAARFTKPEQIMCEVLAQHGDEDYIHDDSTNEPALVVDPRILREEKMVDFDGFKRHFWDIIRGDKHHAGLDSLQVWTQIRSFIKGSFEAAKAGRALTREEYLQLGPRRCRLSADLRKEAYKLFTRYRDILNEEDRWDDMDRTIELIRLLQADKERRGSLRARFDKIYLDEVQDMTQAEIGFFVLLAGGRSGALFLAGDTAQAVAHGVHFRFKEVRSVVHDISQGAQTVAKPIKLCRNFRSHEGILRVAKFTLDRLHLVFPYAADKMEPDTGLVSGPKPAVAHADYKTVKTMVNSNPKLKVLVRDEHRAEVQDILASIGVRRSAVFGLREAKGLEFADVLVLNFFGQSNWQKEWKTLLNDAIADSVDGHSNANDLPGEMELELKLLYTGITRACHHLFFVETLGVQSSKAWFRCLHKLSLGLEVSGTTLAASTKGVMTSEGWLAEGIDLASVAVDRIGEEAVGFWTRAVETFEKAGDIGNAHKERARIQLGVTEAKLRLDEAATVLNASATVAACLDADLIQEAADICQKHCSTPRLRKLGERIQRLGGFV